MSCLRAVTFSLSVMLVPTQAEAAEWVMYCRYFTAEKQPYIDLKFRMYDHETFRDDVEVTFLAQDKALRKPLKLRPPEDEELYALDVGENDAEDAFSIIILDKVLGEIAGIEQWPSKLWLKKKGHGAYSGYCLAVESQNVGA